MNKRMCLPECRNPPLKCGAVMLDPDVKSHFPNSKAVNKALRAVLAHA